MRKYEPHLYAAAFVRDADGQRLGLLRIRLDAQLLGQVLTQTMIDVPELSVSLLDAEGRVLIGVGDSGDGPLSGLPTPAGTNPALATLGEERIAVARVEGTDWLLVVRQPLAAWVAPQHAVQRVWLFETGLLLALLLAVAMLLGWRIAKPLAYFNRVAQRMATGDFGPVAPWPGADEARQLSVALDRLATHQRDTLNSLRQEIEQHRKTEAALRTSHAHYLELVEQLPGAAYRCASRPGWPMEYLSPQIEEICGYTAEELLAGDAQGLTARLTDDVIAANTLATTTAMHTGGRYDLRYPLRHRDGRMRWIWELGSAQQAGNDSSDPSRLVGVLLDVTDEETTNQAMALLGTAVNTSADGNFFDIIAKGMMRVLDVDAVRIRRYCGTPPQSLQSLTLADRDGPSGPIELPLAGTSSETLLSEERIDCGDDAQSRFPDDVQLAASGVRAFFGRRLDARDGRPLGELNVLHATPIPINATVFALLDAFQASAASELERQIALEELQHLADSLERRVIERTAELETSNASLSQAMGRLVQREKLASLGNLVAGVAHELNTPIGNALMVASTLSEGHRQMSSALAAGHLKRSTLENFLQENDEAAQLVERNLQRAATLITHFKQVAVDRASMRRRSFGLDELVADVLLTLSPKLKRLPHVVAVDIPADITLESYPGPLEQVLTNLIENSLVHAFSPGKIGRIRLSAQASEGHVVLRYEDDGIGIPADIHRRVFDPFFTTRLGQGGSGLGLYLVHNLVHGPLGGHIQLIDRAEPGACFLIELPLIAPVTVENAFP